MSRNPLDPDLRALRSRMHGLPNHINSPPPPTPSASALLRQLVAGGERWVPVPKAALPGQRRAKAWQRWQSAKAVGGPVSCVATRAPKARRLAAARAASEFKEPSPFLVGGRSTTRHFLCCFHTEGIPCRAVVLEGCVINALQVAFHIQPYRGRTDLSVHDNVKYIIDKYGKHGAFYRFKSSTGKVLPLFYVYDSYLTPPEAWAELLTSRGSHSLRGTPYDGIFIALIVEERHKHDILASGFDGMYTYFASNGFSFGSSHQNWKALKAFCDGNGLLFVPSAGPGYVDTAVRPWNNHNTRNRVNGRYYETALQAAMSVRPDVITVTSFNEWHEGTQIERAVPKKTVARLYLDYKPHEPDLYLELTRKWAEQFNKEKEQWLIMRSKHTVLFLVPKPIHRTLPLAAAAGPSSISWPVFILRVQEQADRMQMNGLIRPDCCFVSRIDGPERRSNTKALNWERVSGRRARHRVRLTITRA
ncbi:hypothetical protein P4O66_003423 [Electrophorus voltai]|uniref:Mannosidase endo-alpha like n=1 Tax=Electrophorus voltai TaxID=2609070 RepID=A0AAD8YP34_9TELE|nr:hypothetical protein P4O66_003423 [Electrophorus voltai]